MVPRLQSPVTSCLLRVVDNDNGSEVPTVFHSVLPHLYHPNKVHRTCWQFSCSFMYVT